MLTKIQKVRLMDYLTGFLVLAGLYIAACLWDLSNRPVDITVHSVIVEEGFNTGRIKAKHNGGNLDLKELVIKANPGDTIHIEYDVVRRRSADIISERLFVDAMNREYNVNSVQRSVSQKGLRIHRVTADYKVPFFLREGCGSYVFTRAHYDLHYNIFTHIKPVTIEGPKVNICIEKGVVIRPLSDAGSEYPPVVAFE